MFFKVKICVPQILDYNAFCYEPTSPLGVASYAFGSPLWVRLIHSMSFSLRPCFPDNPTYIAKSIGFFLCFLFFKVKICVPQILDDNAFCYEPTSPLGVASYAFGSPLWVRLIHSMSFSLRPCFPDNPTYIAKSIGFFLCFLFFKSENLCATNFR